MQLEPTTRGAATSDVSQDGHDAARELTVGGARVAVLVPAYQAAASLRAVLADVTSALAIEASSVLVIDDGSTDGTGDVAEAAGARVVRCSPNRGKGAALVRGMEEALALGYGVAITVDADGQHPASSARELLSASSDPGALVLGVRDLARDGAPRKNQMSNRISNFFLSFFAGKPLEDTQCGLRRYPLRETLALGARATGYAFEAEILLRAVAARVAIVEHPVVVVYPPEEERVTHFDSVRDPMRIVAAVVRTLLDLRGVR